MAGTITASIVKNDTTSPPTFQNSAGTEIGTLCRAWVNFNGTTSPGTIRASFNVGSVTKNATGDYTANFTTAMPDANYALSSTNSYETPAGYPNRPGIPGIITLSTSSARIMIYSLDFAAARDTSLITLEIHR